MVHGRLLVDPAEHPDLGWALLTDGRIADMGYGEAPRTAAPPLIGGRDRIITPAFIDAHMHVPQIDSVGCDGMPLLEWLDKVIFPAEAWWAKGAALPAARTAARRLLQQGTAGVAAYLTAHAEPSRAALEWLSRATRMRIIAGRVAMDRSAPDELTREDRERVRLSPTPSPLLPAEVGGPRTSVSANPRFAISCSPELLAEVGWAARERPGAFVQTHLAESPDECAAIRSLFPDDASYTAVYDRFGLLHERTLLAHSIHLDASEWRLIAERRSVVVHCPTANVFLRAGLFSYDAACAHGVRVALGTDIAAGPDAAMPRVARAFIETAKVRSMLSADGATVYIPTPAEAWRLITRGNADALGWTDAGRIERGAGADLLTLRVPDTWLDEHLVGRLLYNWSHELIETRIVDGAVIDPATIV